ncbi:MAG TPA: hypothetical protein VGN43_18655 [Steroidobacteraceae bacterium]|nr:hypothetical protein [Steroidobacteraceae bacterium]
MTLTIIHARARARALTALAAAALTLIAGASTAAPAPQRPFHNFGVAIYIPVASTRQLADPKVLQQQFERIWSQVHFNKVYLEEYRSGVFADPASLGRIAGFFRARGITVDGGITLTAADQGGPFRSFDYENPQDVATAQRAVRMAASHFDTVILDDFTFYNTRSDADIRAKGSLSWTQYRLNKMRWVAQHLILGTARSANPHVKVIIKYPNWYEHFQGLGFDLDREAQMFDYIYTGTETRDPVATYQLLQQYESYLIYRYYSNIRPDGGNLGGWVDTFETRYADRYAEQLWDTMLAKAPEITLFSWSQLASAAPAIAGERPWAGEHTSFDWDAMQQAFHAPAGSEAVAGWAAVAGYSLAQVDGIVGKLGKPIGIESYKPYQSSSDEDFLQNYLGNIGFPIDLTPHFPKGAPVALLTENAAFDPNLVHEIEGNLQAGGDVIITSGLLHALEHKGIGNVAEIAYSGLPIAARHYYGTFGPHGGGDLDVPGRANEPVIFPQIHFYTNDSWPLIRGEAAANAVPILLGTGYGRGELYVLDVPANMGQLYQLPQPVLDELRGWLLARFPLRIDAPAKVSLFAYDNRTLVVESYRDSPTAVRIFVQRGASRLVDLASGESVPPAPAVAPGPAPAEAGESSFVVQLAAHSYRAFAVQ